MKILVDYEKEIDNYLKRLFPITRSITGDGNRETLKILQEVIPLKIIEYPSGQKVYDWTIPKEWNIKDAWIKNSKGKKIVDFQTLNLHIVSYSTPVHKQISFTDLKEHLHYLEDLPDAIPYRTSYYDESWGFCISYNQYKSLFKKDEEYEVFIDSELSNGSMSIGELLIKGKSEKEYLISCYICHPSMANDSLSGVLTTSFITKELLKKQEKLEHSYRIIFVPETIGAIAYCANHEKQMKKIKAGIVITTCGGPGNFGYKQSWDSNHWINDIVKDTFKINNINFLTYPFDIHGSDERQYSSQGFRINCVTISKDKYYEYKYYHTNLDNLDFVKAKYINESLNLYLQLIDKIDKNLVYKNIYPNCEIMLSKHNLYPKIGGSLTPSNRISALDIILELLFWCDGSEFLYNIAKKLNVDIDLIYKEAIKLEKSNILKKIKG